MSLVVTATAGLCLWIFMWSLGVSGLDAMGFGLLAVAIVTAVRSVATLTRKDR